MKAFFLALSITLLAACGSNDKKETPAYYEATQGNIIALPESKRGSTLIIPPVSQSLGEYDESLVEPPNLISAPESE